MHDGPGKEKLMFQVCESIKNEKTRNRELGALQQAMINILFKGARSN